MKPTLAILLLTLLLAGPGCVRRRVTVRTNPPGARVTIDREEIGETPVSTGMTYYGTRDIRVEKDGFETVKTRHTFNPPWYQVPPLDFISENLWPYEIRDEREINVQLVPQRIVPTGELLERAETLRGGAQQGHVTPLIPVN